MTVKPICAGWRNDIFDDNSEIGDLIKARHPLRVLVFLI